MDTRAKKYTLDAVLGLACRLVRVPDAGDHALLLAGMLEADVQSDRAALDSPESGWLRGG